MQLEKTAQRLRFGLRWISASQRAWPRFLIVGAMRGGTTTLYRHLTTHSKVRAALDKEVHFFDNNLHKGAHWYRAFFPLRRAMPSDAISGEATPYYLFHPRVPESVAAMLDGVRVIALLRDPVERAFSHYQWAFGRGRETLSFEAALDAEEERLLGEHERLLSDVRYVSYAHQRYSYQSRGRYAEQLERWFLRIDPGSMLILKSETLFESSASTMREILRFLELPHEELGQLPHRNPGSGGKLDPRMTERLRAYFRPHNERLCRLLGWEQAW